MTADQQALLVSQISALPPEKIQLLIFIMAADWMPSRPDVAQALGIKLS